MLNKEAALVSVLVPNRNHARYLGECISSALHQTYTNLEVLVGDNQSDDNSLEVALEIKDARVRVISYPHNILNKTYDLLLDLARGEYVITLCADDVIAPTFIEKAVSLMESNREIGFVHCERDYIDQFGEKTHLSYFFNSSFMCAGSEVAPIFLMTDIAQPAQCVMRRRTLDLCEGFSAEFDHVNADRGLWFKLSLASDYAYIREKLCAIRVHENRESITHIKSFFHPLALYETLLHQLGLAELAGNKDLQSRAIAAREKLARECLKTASAVAQKYDDEVLASRYVNFATLVFPDIERAAGFAGVRGVIQGGGEPIKPCNAEMIYASGESNYPPPPTHRQLTL